MRSVSTSAVLVLLACCISGCGGQASASGGVATVGGATSSGSGMGGAGGANANGTSTCANGLSAPSATRPTLPGCYAYVSQGWVKVPCNCELPIDNTAPATARARFTFTVDPSSIAPTLDGPVDVEITFDDADRSWFNVWASQPDTGRTFGVTASNGSTTVRLGAYSVTLASVDEPSCQSRQGMARVSGDSSAKLVMAVELSDSVGNVLSSVDNSCVVLVPP